MRAYLTEFIGTFFLVLTVGLCANPNTSPATAAMAPLAIGASLMIMVYMGGHVSGGHYNPAVSLAVLIRGKLKGKDFLAYIVAQLAGGLMAAYAASVIMGHATPIAPSEIHVAANNTKLPINLGLCLLVEGLFTFALALVVLNAATAKETAGNSFYGLAIGFTIVVAAFAGGPISGGAFNPAVGTSLTAVSALAGGGSWQYLWLYLVGPLLGGAAAGVVFREQHPDAKASD